MVTRAACKLAFGMDLPVSDFLGSFESELVGELGADLADQFIGLGDLEDTISGAAETAGHRVSQAVAHSMVGDAFENLKSFITQQRTDSAGSLFIEHTDQMRLCDDADGGRVWVSLRNVAKWNSQSGKRNPSIQGGGDPLGKRSGPKVLQPTASDIPGSSENRMGGELAVGPCAVRQVDTNVGLIASGNDAPTGTNGVGGSPVEPTPSASGGCCVVS